MDLQEELSYDELRILVKLAKKIREESLFRTPIRGKGKQLEDVTWNETRIINEIIMNASYKIWDE